MGLRCFPEHPDSGVDLMPNYFQVSSEFFALASQQKGVPPQSIESARAR
jgi:hypothetical protein